MSEETKNKPKVVVQCGQTKVSIWENKIGDNTILSCVPEKIYKTDNEWKSCNSYNIQDIDNLIQCLQTVRTELKPVQKHKVE